MAKENFGEPFLHFGTNAIHAGQNPDQWNARMVVPPITMSTTYKQKGPGETYGFDYSRSGNPTRNCLEQCIASLENGKHAVCMASGLAATDLVVRLLKAGDHIVSMNDLYGGTNRYFRTMKQFEIDITFVDATDINKFGAAFQDNTKLVWIETPTNPMLTVVDIEAVVKITKEKSNAMVAIDNTFATCYFQRPLELGADIVVNSMTKYMNGHSDAVMGCVVVRDDKIAERLRFLQNACGAVPSPFDCFLVNRGLKTMHVRMKQHMTNGLSVARFLEANSRVKKVLHPGLVTHPQHLLAKRQMRGFSGMVTVYLDGGIEESRKFLQKLELFTTAESLGGYESLAELPLKVSPEKVNLLGLNRTIHQPDINKVNVGLIAEDVSSAGTNKIYSSCVSAIMTHASVPKDQREELGIGDNLIRLSVGLEEIDDLIADLDQALKAAIP